MSKLLTEISRIHKLMGIKNHINESLIYNKILLKEGTGIGEIMDIYKSIFKKGGVELTENESKYLKNLVDEYNVRFPDSKFEFVNGLDNLSFRKLSDFITKQTDEVLTDFFGSLSKNIYRKEISELGIKGFLSLDQAFQEIMNSQKIIGGLADSSGEAISIYGHINYIYQKGGVKNSDLPDSILTELKNELKYLIKDPKKLGSLSDDDPFKKYCNDIISQIDESQNTTVKETNPEIFPKLKEIQDSIPLNKTNTEDISSKLKSLSNSDQTMRQGDGMDITVDINNQVELKKLMGDDIETFIKDLKTFEDLENLWVIVQHSDNDIEFQKEILKILQNNQQTLETKFSTNSQDIKMGIAMLEDRVLINSKTSSSNFGDLTQGLQKYGSQGGLTDDGYWIPRPIDIDGNPIYFKTPNEWYNLNKETLDKINSKRSSMGLPNIEDYIKNMNDKFGNSSGSVKTTEDLSPRLKNKYEKVLNKIDKDLPLNKSEQQLKDDVEKFLNGENINLKDYEFTKTYIDKVNTIIKNFTRNKKEYTSILKELIASIDNTTKITSNIENTFPKGLDKNIRNAINSDPNLTNFFKKLEEGKYGWVIDNETKEWIPTNMLDTNTNDRTTLFRDVLDIVMENDGKKLSEFTTLPEEEQKKLMNDVLTYIKTNKDSLKYKLLDSDRYIKNSQVSLVRGDEGEKLAKQTFEESGFKVVWEGGRGNALDKTGVDMIVEKDGVYSLVSVKTIGHEFYVIKSVKTGKPLIGFRQPTKIVTDTGYAAVFDTKNRLIIFPPQPKFSKETGEIVGKGFNKGNNEGKLWTNVDLSSILIKNF